MLDPRFSILNSSTRYKRCRYLSHMPRGFDGQYWTNDRYTDVVQRLKWQYLGAAALRLNPPHSEGPLT